MDRTPDNISSESKTGALPNTNTWYMVWRDDTDYCLYYAQNTKGTWGNAVKATSDRIGTPPSTAYMGDTIYVVFRDLATNDVSWVSSTDSGDTWSTPVQIPGVHTPYPPAIVAFKGWVYVIYTGADKQIYMTESSDMQKWTDIARLPEKVKTGQGPAAVMQPQGEDPQLLHVLWASSNDNHWIYYITQERGVWGNIKTVTHATSTQRPSAYYSDVEAFQVGFKGSENLNLFTQSYTPEMGWQWPSEIDGAQSPATPGICTAGYFTFVVYPNLSKQICLSYYNYSESWQQSPVPAGFNTSQPVACSVISTS